MILNCVIIDQDPMAAALLAGFVEKTPALRLVATYSNAVDAIKDIRQRKADLVFIDVDLPQISGIEFATILPAETKVIFTASNEAQAAKGYKVGALDFLVKPFDYGVFTTAVNKAIVWFNQTRRVSNYSADRFILVKSDYKLVQVRFDDILYIEGLKDYVRFHVETERKSIMSLMNMKKLEEALPFPEFMRTHRSYIVHMPKVTIVDRFRFGFGDKFLPISESYKETVLNYFEQHSIL